MRTTAALATLLLAVTVSAEKPWETRLDLAVPVPVELPAIAPFNPFATPASSGPTAIGMPLRKKLVGTFPVTVAAYVDGNGVCQRLVLLRGPWTGLGAELQAAFTTTPFTPGRSFGGPVATWMPAIVDLRGRIDGGRVLTIQVSLPDPEAPYAVDPLPTPSAEPHDLARQAVPVERLDQLPVPKRFRARINARTWRENVRFLAEVGASGKVERVVFLACPDGLRGWLLASLTGWSFHPAEGASGPVKAWGLVEATLEVVASDLAADALRAGRETLYPRADAPPAADRPPGG